MYMYMYMCPQLPPYNVMEMTVSYLSQTGVIYPLSPPLTAAVVAIVHPPLTRNTLSYKRKETVTIVTVITSRWSEKTGQ